MAPTVLKQLVKEPFGPFPDSDVLNDALKSTRLKPLSLSNVYLKANDRVVGFDTTEPYQPEHIAYTQVKMFGTLEIVELGWLSDNGRRVLQRALRDRDSRARNGSDSALTLEGLYGSRTNHQKGRPGLIIKVIISTVKNMTVSYLTSDRVPNELRIDTKSCAGEIHRWFIVSSLKGRTLKKSRKFLGRYRTLRVLKDVLEYDSQLRRVDDSKPYAERTPLWFARMYIRRIRELNENGESSVHLSSDSSGTESESDEPTRRIGPYQNTTLRHNKKKDILEFLHKYSDWLIHDQERRIQKQKRLFDPDVWRYWRWDLEPREESESDDDMGIDEDEDGRARTQGMSVKAKGKRRASERSSGDEDGDDGRAYNRPRLGSRSPIHDNPVTASYQAQRGYDPDCFLPSSSDWNPSDTPSCPSRPPTPDSPTLIARVRNISTAFYYEPDPPKSALWYCPVRTCYYCVDLLELTEEQKDVLGQELVNRLQGLRWCNGDEWVKDACKTLSRAHYADHMRSAGVRMWWDKWLRPRLAYHIEGTDDTNAEQPTADKQDRPRVKQEED